MLKDILANVTSTNIGKRIHDSVMNCRSRNTMPNCPKFLHIETTSICNAKCVMCAYSQMKRPKQIMKEDLFEKIIIDASKMGITWVNLQFYGEPLTDKNVFQRIHRLKDIGFKVKLNTNASLLNEEKCVLLMDTGIDQINISFDAFDRETYNRIRVGLDYDDVIRNIEYLIRIRGEKKANTKIMMTFVCIEANKHEANTFSNKWKGVADRILVSYARDWAGNLRVDGKKSLLSVDNNICKSLWKDFIILQDGTVALCCQDYEGRGDMGNLNYQTIEEVWNGEKFVKYRKFHKEGKRSELEICKRCDYFSFWWNK